MRVTRPEGFQFRPGQFARIGLPTSDESDTPEIWRAYSMVTHPDQQSELEFYSVTVPEGEFSPRLAALQPGDPLWIERNPFGFLTLERFGYSNTLWLLGTGTGLSAYLPMLSDQETWDKFGTVILVHGVRTSDELAYREEIAQHQANATENHLGTLIYLPVTSRQPWPSPNESVAGSRITTAIDNGTLEKAAGHSLDPEKSCVMLCGNPEMVTEVRKMLTEKGFAAGRRGNLGNLAVENYW